MPIEGKHKRNRTRWAVLGLAVGAFVVMGIWRAWPRGPLLTELGHPFAEDPWHAGYFGVNGHQCLVATYYPEGESEQDQHGLSRWKYWNGSVALRDVNTGARTELPGLTKLFKQPGLFNRWSIGSWEVSPDGTWLRWETYDPVEGKVLGHAAHLDGTHYRTLKPIKEEGAGFFWDDYHYIQMSYGAPTVVYDLSDPCTEA